MTRRSELTVLSITRLTPILSSVVALALRTKATANIPLIPVYSLWSDADDH